MLIPEALGCFISHKVYNSYYNTQMFHSSVFMIHVRQIQNLLIDKFIEQSIVSRYLRPTF